MAKRHSRIFDITDGAYQPPGRPESKSSKSSCLRLASDDDDTNYSSKLNFPKRKTPKKPHTAASQVKKFSSPRRKSTLKDSETQPSSNHHHHHQLNNSSSVLCALPLLKDSRPPGPAADSCVYDFEDDETHHEWSCKIINNTAKGECVKPKRQWMRLEGMLRYQEARKISIQNLQKSSTAGVDLDEGSSSSPSRPTVAGGAASPCVKKKQKPPPRRSRSSTQSMRKSNSKANHNLPKRTGKRAVKHTERKVVKQKLVAAPDAVVNNKLPAESAPQQQHQQHSISCVVQSTGATLSVNDIIWAKLQGYPFWPAKIVSICTVQNDSPAAPVEYIVTVVWYHWGNFHSSFPVEKVLPFKANYQSLFQPKRRGNYVLAVEEACKDSGLVVGVGVSSPPPPPSTEMVMTANVTDPVGTEHVH